MWIVKKIVHDKETIIGNLQGTPDKIKEFMKNLPIENCHYSALDTTGKHKEIFTMVSKPESKITGFFKSLF